MGEQSLSEIELFTRQCFDKAKRSLQLHKGMRMAMNEAAISDVVPGYEAQHLDFGDYIEDQYAVLFVDMRDSTGRAQRLGPEKTFLTMHAYIPALLATIGSFQGYVLDIMGDGIMTFFTISNKSDDDQKKTVQQAGICGLGMLQVVQEIVNPILQENNIPSIKIGVGLDCGPVVVTKVGTPNVYDVKAFGDCINLASKLSDEAEGQLLISPSAYDRWPSSSTERIKAEEKWDRERGLYYEMNDSRIGWCCY